MKVGEESRSTSEPMDGIKQEQEDELKPKPTSLEILKPEPWVPREKTPPRGRTEWQLEQLSKGLIEAFCASDFSTPLLDYVSPSFQAYIDYNAATVRSLSEHIEFHKQMYRDHPGYEYKVSTVSADVDEAKGLASVWATLRVTGHPHKIQRESVTIFWWRRRANHWKVYKQFGVRGVRWFEGVND